MNKPILACLVVLSSLAATTPALAGLKNDALARVVVDPVARWAKGALGSARNSPNTLEYIGCYRNGDMVYCVAQAHDRTIASCWVVDPVKAATVSGITTASYVYFSYNPAGTCTTILVENTSIYPPMVP